MVETKFPGSKQIIIQDETTIIGEEINIQSDGEGAQVIVDGRVKLEEVIADGAAQVIDNRGATIGRQVNISGGAVLSIQGIIISPKPTNK